jgi:8-oxo-dGTP pyrophosphatase MutT (NUDIX family)
MQRHFTVTGFVSTQGHTLLHWHAKNQMWLPPGGHIEPDEDPIQALHREILEETGLRVTVLPAAQPFPYPKPQQLDPPNTVMIEEIAANGHEAAHQHIDLIYFTRPATLGPLPTPPDGWRWVTAADLRANVPLAPTELAAAVSVPEDVRVLGIAATAQADQPDAQADKPEDPT